MVFIISENSRDDSEAILKDSKLNDNTKYYHMTEVFDQLYKDSSENCNFTNLMDTICCRDNILLAYRNIKSNSGSNTAGVDKKTIKDLNNLQIDEIVELVRHKLNFYKPKRVKRVEIPKANGKTRPLGIPTIEDRLIQQCIKQVLEPIAEAKFYRNSFGFRPNRSAEHAMAYIHEMVHHSQTYIFIDVDIKGFFDNVNHRKLLKQMWNLGIRDKKLLMIIREILKSEIALPNNKIVKCDKGTPQGGIISPLLANIYLNELDWWVAKQWDEFDSNFNYTKKYNKICALKKTGLKEMHIVRYADDFKILCRHRDEATKIYHALKQQLEQKFHLEVSEEKTKIVDIRKGCSEFLGFKIKAVQKGKDNKGNTKFAIQSNVGNKAMKNIPIKLNAELAKLEDESSQVERKGEGLVRGYGSIVIGLHNYYKIATHASKDFRRITYMIMKRMKKLEELGIVKKIDYENMNEEIEEQLKTPLFKNYKKSKAFRRYRNTIIIPVSYVQHKRPLQFNQESCNYTSKGRELLKIKQLKTNVAGYREVYRNYIPSESVEYNDNRLHLFIAQRGKCRISGEEINAHNMHCHHVRPRGLNGTDKYENLVLVHERIHRLIHASRVETIQTLINESKFPIPKKVIVKINEFRQQAQKQQIIV